MKSCIIIILSILGVNSVKAQDVMVIEYNYGNKEVIPVSAIEDITYASYWDTDYFECFIGGEMFIPVFNHYDYFWRLLWIDENGVKVVYKEDYESYSDCRMTLIGGSCANKVQIENNKIFTTESSRGWYIVMVKAVYQDYGNIAGVEKGLEVYVQSPDVYLIGTATKTGGCWDEKMADWKLSIPTTQYGSFVSPAFADDIDEGSGVRAYVYLDALEGDEYYWWQSEFMIYDGQILYRGNGEDQYPRINGTKGQKLSLDFSNNAGIIY